MMTTFQIAFYKGTHVGVKGWYNRLVRWWTRGPFSHVEVVFSDGACGSASYVDGGVRYTSIDFNLAKWVLVPLPAALEPAARAYFDVHQGEGYDLLGNLRFLFDFLPDDPRKKFCSEAVAESLGIADGWRFDPNTLYAVATALQSRSSPEQEAA